MIGIYKITSPSNRVYIGQSVDIHKRFTSYKGIDSLIKQTRLHASFIKYGYINHKFEIVEECTIEELNSRERFWQDAYDVLSKNGLNCMLTETDELPRKDSDITRQKKSIGNLGKKRTPEMNERNRIVQTGKIMSKESSEKKRIAMIGKIVPAEVGRKISESKNKLVLDTSTGIFYTSCGEAAIALGISRRSLSNKLVGARKNNTNLIYC